jgi:hypothetical protein
LFLHFHLSLHFHLYHLNRLHLLCLMYLPYPQNRLFPQSHLTLLNLMLQNYLKSLKLLKSLKSHLFL